MQRTTAGEDARQFGGGGRRYARKAIPGLIVCVENWGEIRFPRTRQCMMMIATVKQIVICLCSKCDTVILF
jgi:hypothetical protein